MPYFEDVKIGYSRDLGSFTFTADLIKTFARQFDPQPFHLDEEAGRKSVFGGLAASGWHVAAIYMKLTGREFQARNRGDDCPWREARCVGTVARISRNEMAEAGSRRRHADIHIGSDRDPCAGVRGHNGASSVSKMPASTSAASWRFRSPLRYSFQGAPRRDGWGSAAGYRLHATARIVITTASSRMKRSRIVRSD